MKVVLVLTAGSSLSDDDAFWISTRGVAVNPASDSIGNSLLVFVPLGSTNGSSVVCVMMSNLEQFVEESGGGRKIV